MLTLAGSSENLSCPVRFGKMAKWSFSKLGGRPVCAFVVSSRVEQSDLREGWFCIHFHFGCDILRFTMEEVWVNEKMVLLPLESVRSRLQVKVSSQYVHFLMWVHFRTACRA